MPYNGTGIFSRIYQWVNDAANDLDVDATRTDTDSNDIADGLTNCVTRDGQSPWLTNLPAGGMKITSLAAGTAAGDSVNYGQVFNGASFVTPYATTTPTLIDNPLRLATVGTVTAAAFATVLPAQPGGPESYTLKSSEGAADWNLDTTTFTDATALAQAHAIALSF